MKMAGDNCPFPLKDYMLKACLRLIKFKKKSSRIPKKKTLNHIPIDNPDQRQSINRTFCANAISYDCLALTKSTLRLHINLDEF